TKTHHHPQRNPPGQSSMARTKRLTRKTVAHSSSPSATAAITSSCTAAESADILQRLDIRQVAQRLHAEGLYLLRFHVDVLYTIRYIKRHETCTSHKNLPA
ncbi:hypothetical protein, partial [Martelella mediterranea]|uniref:hypothetical protein n=1 Tax=Martelella mediterranea TaxID=293089 RepID=UPI001AEC5F63